MFFFDVLSIMMLLLVTCVSFIVHVYSLNYMYNDPYQSRFLAYLSLFTFFMIVLVTAANLCVFLVG